MDIARFTDVSGFGRLEWAVFGLHALVGGLFLVAAAQTVVGGGAFVGAGLQTLVGLMLLGLGLTVAQVVRDR
jgi:hypothetical protein